MSLAFPPIDHVPLRNPPIKEVVCQIRFPIILEIPQQSPVAFQNVVRERFPVLEVVRGLLVAVPEEPSQPMQSEFPPTVYRFFDKDHVRAINLSAGFFAITTTRYQSWAAFADDLKFATQAIIDTYKPQVATRIGLRYTNILNKANIGTSTFNDVLEMLQPSLTAPVRIAEIQGLKLGITHLITEHEDSIFSFRSGALQEEEAEELSFVLDFDYYIETNIDLEVESLLARCDHYHALIYDAFRWCILPDKLRVFDPGE